MRGKYWLMMPFKMGKHAQMTHVFTSRELHIAAMTPSQVGSCDTEATYIACSRSKEAIQVLVKVSRISCAADVARGRTDIPPMQKTTVSAIF